MSTSPDRKLYDYTRALASGISLAEGNLKSILPKIYLENKEIVGSAAPLVYEGDAPDRFPQAYDSALDRIGSSFNVFRAPNETDDAYRQKIKLAIIQNPTLAGISNSIKTVFSGLGLDVEVYALNTRDDFFDGITGEFSSPLRGTVGARSYRIVIEISPAFKYSFPKYVDLVVSGDSFYRVKKPGLYSIALDPNKKSGDFNKIDLIKRTRQAANDVLPNVELPARGGNLVNIYKENNKTYVYHKFTNSGTFVPLKPLNVEYLVVGGGGGGGRGSDGGAGGGGGGGGVLMGSLLLENEVDIVVGLGGFSPTSSTGGSSLIGDFVEAFGGGNGGSFSELPQEGGSGGGGSFSDPIGAFGLGGQGSQGGYFLDIDSHSVAGGGGGFSSIGGTGVISSDELSGFPVFGVGGTGGEGIESSITGIPVVYGSGGGGGVSLTADTGLNAYLEGGEGGTNAGVGGSANYLDSFGSFPVVAPGQSGVENTGAGGGGGAHVLLNPSDVSAMESSIGGPGGSGIVVLRYEIEQESSLEGVTVFSSEVVSPNTKIDLGFLTQFQDLKVIANSDTSDTSYESFLTFNKQEFDFYKNPAYNGLLSAFGVNFLREIFQNTLSYGVIIERINVRQAGSGG